MFLWGYRLRFPPGGHHVGGCHPQAASWVLILRRWCWSRLSEVGLRSPTASRSLRISSHCCSAIMTSCWLELVNFSTNNSSADVFSSKRDTSTGNCRHDVLFADDTNIFCSNENVEVLQDTLNRELAKLFVWFSINKLSLNLGKTNYMLFRSRPPDIELHLKINNADIPKVTATKLLGIIIDDRLNWKPHIQSVKSKLSCILSIMYKTSTLITTAGMYTLYCSLFQPHIS